VAKNDPGSMILMKEEYDFTTAEQGKFYHPIDELEIPVYLDKDNDVK